MDISEVTQEQLDALEAKVGALEKEKDESAAKLAEYETAKTEWEKKEKDYQEQQNPNWARARKTIDALKVIAREKGVQVDDEGNIVSNPNQVDVEQMKKDAAEAGAQAARSELLGGRLEELLSEYDDESAKLVRHFYDKLIVGETVTLQNINKFLQQAHTAAEVESGNQIKKTKKVTSYSGGQGPRLPEEGKADETVVKNLADHMGVKISGEEQK